MNVQFAHFGPPAVIPAQWDKLTMMMVICVLILTGCSQSPTDVLVDPTTSAPNGSFGSTYVIYAEELQSGGGAMLYPNSNEQSLTFDNRDGAASGAKAIRYAWTGQDVFDSCRGSNEHTFAGVSLIVSSLVADFDSAPAHNLSAAGYTKVRFAARGSLAANTVLKVEAPDDGALSSCSPATTAPCIALSTDGTLDDDENPCGTKGTLRSSWTTYTIDLSGQAAAMASVKEYFKATFVYNQPPGTTPAGNGGTVYLDDILYTQ